MHEVDGLRGRGEDPSAMVETGFRGEIDEGHVRKYFGGGEVEAAAGIRQAWRGRGRGGG